MAKFYEKYDFKSPEAYYRYIEASFDNGQFTQVAELHSEMSPVERLDFFAWMMKYVNPIKRRDITGIIRKNANRFNYYEPEKNHSTSSGIFSVTLRHDGGLRHIATSASSMVAAIEQVCKAEGCPMRAIIQVKRK